MNDEQQYRQQSLQLAQQQLVARYLGWWQDFLEIERRKSPQLPVLWGHKGYAQNDEDGIVNEIFKRIGVRNRTFFEVGVGDGTQNNSLFWLKQGWRGAWIEGSPANAGFIRHAFAGVIARGDLHFQERMVTAEAIDDSSRRRATVAGKSTC